MRTYWLLFGFFLLLLGSAHALYVMIAAAMCAGTVMGFVWLIQYLRREAGLTGEGC
jgi:hypothetical protein